MKKNASFIAIVTILVLSVISAVIFVKNEYDRKTISRKNESTSVTKIRYNQTYTYDSTKDGSYHPSYIKFIDRSHYVAIPVLNTTEDVAEDGVMVAFLQGKYQKDKNKLQLGYDVHNTTLIFDDNDKFKRGIFEKIESDSSRQSQKAKFPFEENYLKKKGKYYVYRWKTRQGDYPHHATTGFVRLKKSKLDIPSTEKGFIQRYHKKQKHQQE